MNILDKHPDKKSRDVKESDISRVLSAAKQMQKLCFKKIGRYNGGYAVAHVQVDGNDPLRFFVKKDGTIYINPTITAQNQKYKHKEGCLSFSKEFEVEVDRHNLVTVEFFEAHTADKTIDMEFNKRRQFSGMDAAIFQHEIEHFDLNLIY